MVARDKWFPNILAQDGELDAQEVFQSTRLAWESIYTLQKDIEGTMEVVGDMVDSERLARARSPFGPDEFIGDTRFVGGGGGGGEFSVLNAERNRLPYLNDALNLDARDAPQFDPGTQKLTISGNLSLKSDTATIFFGIAEDTQLRRVGANILAMDNDATDPEFQLVTADEETGVLRWVGARFEIGTITGSPRDLEFIRGGTRIFNVNLNGINPAPGKNINWLSDTVPIDAIILDGADRTTPGQTDSHSLLWTGRSFDASAHDADWKQFVDVTSDAGASTFRLQTRIDAAAFDNKLTISDLGEFRIKGVTSVDDFFFDSGTVIGTTGAGIWLGANAVTPSSTNYQIRTVGSNQLRINAGGTPPSQSIRFSISDVEWGRATNIGQNFWLFEKKLEIRLGEDQIGFLVTGHSTQTSDLVEWQQDDGTNLLNFSNAGEMLLGNELTSPIDAITFDSEDLVGDGQRDSHALVLTAKGFESATPHDTDWKTFIDAQNDDGTGSILTIQTRVDAASYVSQLLLNSVGDLTLPAEDKGNDVPGKLTSVQNNTSAGAEGGAPGVIELFSADGTPCYIWCKNDGGLAIGTARPTGSTGSPTVPSEIGGVVVSTPSLKSYSFESPPGGPGTFFVSGFYDFDTDDANLDQGPPPGNTSVTHGNTDVPYGAHAAIVAGGAGTASGGAGTVEIEVSGTSITDAGVRTASDTEILVADVTTLVLNQYIETAKKWIGPVTFTLQNSSGSTHTAFTADFNFGFSRYEDFGANNFFIESWDFVGLAGANDGVFNIELLHHDDQNWTYAATGFVPGGTVLVDYRSDYTPEADLDNTLPFSFQRTGIDTLILAESGEGLLMRITTGANNSVVFLDLHVAGLFT